MNPVVPRRDTRSRSRPRRSSRGSRESPNRLPGAAGASGATGASASDSNVRARRISSSDGSRGRPPEPSSQERASSSSFSSSSICVGIIQRVADLGAQAAPQLGQHLALAVGALSPYRHPARRPGQHGGGIAAVVTGRLRPLLAQDARIQVVQQIAPPVALVALAQARLRAVDDGDRPAPIEQPVRGDIERLGEGRVAVELLAERAAGAGDAAHLVGDVHRQADRAALLGERAGDRLADPPGRVGRELVAECVIELLDGADQAEVAFLDQVEQRHAGAGVVPGDRHDEPQVALDQPILRLLVALVLAAGELALLGMGQQTPVADLADVELERVLRRSGAGSGVASSPTGSKRDFARLPSIG